MVTRRYTPTILAHLVLITGVTIIAFPVWMALVASTHPPEALSINPIPMWFGSMGPENYRQLLSGECLLRHSEPLRAAFIQCLLVPLLCLPLPLYRQRALCLVLCSHLAHRAHPRFVPGESLR